MVKAIEETVKAIEHAMHLAKPMLINLALFVVFLVEIWHWLHQSVMSMLGGE